MVRRPMNRNLNYSKGNRYSKLIFYYQNEQSDIINFLTGYRYAKDNYDGWWEDALNFYTSTDKNLWYNESVRVENINASTNDIIYGFRYNSQLGEDEYPSSNFEDLNISKANLFAFVEGAFAAWHYSKIKPAE